jgi:hypothetical protein
VTLVGESKFSAALPFMEATDELLNILYIILLSHTLSLTHTHTHIHIRYTHSHILHTYCSRPRSHTHRVWDVSNGQMLNTLVHHCEAVLHLRFNNSTMVTCSKVSHLVYCLLPLPINSFYHRLPSGSYDSCVGHENTKGYCSKTSVGRS